MYIGCTSTTFKERYNKHISTINNSNHANPTELTHHMWDNRESNIPSTIEWSIIGRSKPYKPGDTYCKLCNNEKTEIIYWDSKEILNDMKITEKCRHRKKHTLETYKTLNVNYNKIPDKITFELNENRLINNKDKEGDKSIQDENEPVTKKCVIKLVRMTEEEINELTHEMSINSEPNTRRSKRKIKPRVILDL